MNTVLLTFEDSELIDEYSIGCIGVNTVFSPNVIKILSRKCSEKERERRKIVFSSLLYEKNAEMCDNLLNCIKQFKKKYDEISGTLSKIKRVFLISKIIDVYSDVLKVSGSINFGDKWSNYISALGTEFGLLEKERVDFKEELRFFDSFSLVVGRNRFSILPSYSFGAEENIGVQVRSIRKALLDCELGEHGVVSTIPDSIQTGLEQLYPGQTEDLYNKAESIFDKIHYEICDNIEALSFYSEISHFTIKAVKKGISVCLPKYQSDGEFIIKKGYDITLEDKIADIIPNDVYFDNQSNTAFVIGTNGGGKTTFLRMIAVNCLLACAGCPTFCDYLRITVPQKIFALFPEGENSASGNFDSDVIRINNAVKLCSSGNFYFFNEPFSGTNEEKGLSNVIDLIESISSSSSKALIVTHFDKVTEYNFPIYSTCQNEVEKEYRQYVIRPYKEEGGSYTEAVLKRYGLDVNSLRLRVISGDQNEKYFV